MKNECNVVRDLMPLCIDGVASGDSQQLVEAHRAACPSCAEIYRQMQQELPDVDEKRDESAMEHAAKAARTKRKIRALWAMVMSMAALIIVLVLHAGEVAQMLGDAWFQLRFVGPGNQLRLEALNVSLEWFPFSGVRLKMESSPSGNRPFRADLQLRYDEMTGEAYLQVRAYADETQERDVFYINDTAFYPEDFVFEYDHMHVDPEALYFQYPLTPEGGSWASERITHIELVYGEETLLLWQTGDGLPAYCHAGQLERGTEPIPTATPTSTPMHYTVYTSPSGGGYRVQTTTPTPSPTPRPGPTTPPPLPPHKR